MKKIFFAVLIAVIILPLMANMRYVEAFTAAFNLNASTTATTGSAFTSAALKVCEEKTAERGLLTMSFARAAGTALTVDFYFQVSFDGGMNWGDYIEPFSIATEHSVINGTTVTVSRPIYLYGVSHIRLSKVVNNDTVNNLTAVIAILSW